MTKAQDDPQFVSLVESVGAPPPFHPKAKNFGDEHKAWVLAFLRELPSPQMAARVIGCSVDNLYEHRKRDPAFKAGWDAAMEDSYDTLLGMAAEEAAGVGVRHVVTGKGEVIAVPKDRNDKILSAFINFRLGQRHIHEGLGEFESGTMMIAVTPRQLDCLTRDERGVLTYLLAKLEANAPKTIDGVVEPPRKIAGG